MKMNHAAQVAAAALCVFFGGCATIIAKSSQTITVTSEPPNSAVSITNAAGVAVHSGSTPMTVTLKKGRGYFKAEHYLVRITKEGFQAREVHVRGEVNGWYIGNVIFGGLIGLLAVDPATGAMYTLKPKEIGATLDAVKVTRNHGQQTLSVLLIEEVPTELVSQLIPIPTY
jgi:hypothetical protein